MALKQLGVILLVIVTSKLRDDRKKFYSIKVLLVCNTWRQSGAKEKKENEKKN